MNPPIAQQDATTSLLQQHLHDTVHSFRAWTVSLPLGRRLHHATADVAALTAVVVEVELSDGARGYAEVRSNGAYATGEDESTIVSALRAAPPTGKTLNDIAGDLSGRSCLALMAIDTAAWDALARRKDIPLYRAWNDVAAETSAVRTHAQIGFGDADAARTLAESFVAAGFDRLKVRVGAPDLSADIARLQAIRAAVGPEVRLVIDANGGWTYDQAAAGIDAITTIGADWIEQPVMSIAEMARLRRNSGTAIYADESVRDVASVEALIAAEAVDGVHLKLEKAGTVAQLFQTVARARVNGVSVTIGQMDQGRLGCAVTTHLAAALGSERAELWGWAGLTRDLTEQLAVEDGCVLIPHDAGHGITDVDTSFAQEIS
ncbi:mandelate racemase/muconate lactonizing enzyme family protein [Mycolicibacterium mageritense]|uniref:O-succinylbenzoate synthase n=1 Tax=Mycolicibacterium mageritense TaxID=53462 RepID=A0AAI8TPY4_MYCME|nr:enolase C-terminal domain-like protein [Mycolicibacterium mageritense]BDY26701.1 o-succinylbenzoate synthase [Mycolicibacterium mageritense]